MGEKIQEGELRLRVDSIQLGLAELGDFQDIVAVALYAMPPWKTKGEQDLDVLLVIEETSEDINAAIDEKLQIIASGNIDIDAWVLTPNELTKRMKRVAGVHPNQPPIYRNSTEWSGFGFVPIAGEEYITEQIADCYTNPEPGGIIPADSNEHRVFLSAAS